jgi:hypothetical protein
MVFQAVVLLVLLVEIGGVSVPSLAGCAIEYLTVNEMLNSTTESEVFEDDCEARIESETQKFYDDFQNLISSGANVDNLENVVFIEHEKCILEALRQYNVSTLYLKGIAYQKLNKVHRSEHSFNMKMTSQQILLLYALQVCEPRSFYARHAEKIFTMNMRTSNAQAHCLLNHLNENSADEPYQFGEETESIGDLDAHKCDEIVREFVRKYYNVIDRARNFSIFGLHPENAMKCRASNDKSLINHMILLTVFPRLRFTPDQIELEKIRFFEIARDSARSFFKCISMYD